MKVGLFDAHHLMHRMMHVPELLNLTTVINNQVVNVGAIFGVLRSLRFSQATNDFDMMICVWDSGKSKRRMELYPEYKYRGEKTDEDRIYIDSFVLQKKLVMGLLPCLGIRNLAVEGKEADDLIAKSCGLYSERDYVIISEDSDFYQLVRDRVTQFRPIKGELLTPEVLKEKYGLFGDQFIWKKAMTGDTSDNISSVSGVGESTASGLAKELVKSTFDENLELLKSLTESHKSARFRKVFSGIEIVKRNYKLVDLSQEIYSNDDFYAVLDAQNIDLRTPSTSDWNKAFRVVNELAMKSLTSDFSTWSFPFRKLS